MLHSMIKGSSCCTTCRLKDSSEGTVRTLVDMEGSYLSANFFREIVAAESFSYNSNAPKPAFVTLSGKRCMLPALLCILGHTVFAFVGILLSRAELRG
jgi:hypothetical protein